jgi:type IV pilus assembly protein PilW
MSVMNSLNKPATAKHSGNQHGLSLVELMVSLAVGLLVTGIVIAMFSQSKRSFNQDNAVSVMQENGRFALQILQNEIMHAGLAGSMHVPDTIVPLPTPSGDCSTKVDWSNLITSPIEYYENASDPDLNCITGAKPNTHALIIKRTSQTPYTSFDNEKNYFYTEGLGGTFFVGSNSAPGAEGTSWEYYAHIYYIADTNGIPGLYRKRLIGDTVGVGEEVVPGIADFAIQFGVDDVDDNIARTLSYTTDLAAANSPLSITARISVLAQSLSQDFSTTNSRKFSLYPSDTSYFEYGITDRNYFGRVFTTTAAIRNNAYRMSSALISVNQ